MPFVCAVFLVELKDFLAVINVICVVARTLTMWICVQTFRSYTPSTKRRALKFWDAATWLCSH